MQVREARSDDTASLAELFFDSVRIGAAPAYTTAQRAAWAAERPSSAAWALRLSGMLTLVGEDAAGPSGFMSLRLEDGYLDLAFVRPEARGTGVADKIYTEIENRACAHGLALLHTEASHMAKSFFERHGWRVLSGNTVTRSGLSIDNWIMEKQLI